MDQTSARGTSSPDDVLFRPAIRSFGHSKEWTVLIFMNGKNNHGEFALDNFSELSKIGSTADIDFVVQLGRPERRPGEQAEFRNVFGGWTCALVTTWIGSASGWYRQSRRPGPN